MATFRVGQRVRLIAVRKVGEEHRIGKQGTIRSIGTYGPGETIEVKNGVRMYTHRGCDCTVKWDNSSRPFTAVKFWQLEPVQPEGNKVVEWSECLWQPEHLKEEIT